MRNRKPLFLLDIELNSGTERLSDRQVNSPTVTYEPFIVSWGIFESGIPSPCGLPITGDAKFRLAESETRKWRDLFSHQTPRRRKVKLWTLFEGESLSTLLPATSPSSSPPDSTPRTPFFSGEIVNAVFNADRSIEITCRDLTYAWLDEPIPAMITKDIIPGLESRYEGQFLPIVAGQVRTPDPEIASPLESPPSRIPQSRGQIALPRMGWNDETGDRWGVTAHPSCRIVVFRKVEAAVDGDETEIWERVSPGEYEERLIRVNAFNLEMNWHVIDFFVEQPDDTELRADIDGIGYRGAWGSLPEVGTPISSPPTGTGSPPDEALRNHIDFFINMTFFVMNKAGVSGGDGSVFDTEEISALRDKFDFLELKCDGAITEPITCREFLLRFLTSANLDMWQKRSGKISLAFTDEENPDRPIYTETSLILKNSFTEQLPEKPINQFQYRYLYNFAEQSWGTWGLLDTSDQEILAIGEDPKIEKEVLDLYFVRDPETALSVTQHRSQFLSLGSYQQQWELPLPEVPVSLEPSSLVGVTHRMGLEIGGYNNREVKILKLRHDLDKLTTTVNGVLRVPQTLLPMWSGETYFEALDFGIFADGGVGGTYQRSIFSLPHTGFTKGYTTFFLEIIGENTDGVLDGEWTVYPYVFTTPDLTKPQTVKFAPDYAGRIRSTTPFVPDARTPYYIIRSPESVGGVLYKLRVVGVSKNSPTLVSEICLSNGSGATTQDQGIGGGDIFRTTSTTFVSVNGPRWKYIAEDWSHIVAITHFVKMANASFDTSQRYSQCALWDLDDDLPVAIISAKGYSGNMFVNPQPFAITFDKSILTSGHTYETRIASIVESGGNFNTYYSGSRIQIFLSHLETFEVHERIGNTGQVQEVRGTFAVGTLLTPPEVVAVEGVVLLEVHGDIADFSDLTDYGTSDTATSGAAIPAANVIVPSGTELFDRSANIRQYLTPGNRYAATEAVLQASLVTKFPPLV